MSLFIRVDSNFIFHPKILTLRKQCGLAGIGSLVMLWCWTSLNRPTGSLAEMDDAMIENVSAWDGEPGKFILALRSTRLITRTGPLQNVPGGSKQRSYCVHNFGKRQTFFSQLERIQQHQERQRRYRQRHNVTQAPSPRDAKVTLRGEERRIEEKDLDQKPRAKTALDLPAGFAAFWDAYPRKVGKIAALRSWRKAKPSPDAVLQALAWQVKSEKWTEGYIPNPATYLNQGRWEDEPPRPAAVLNFGQERYDQKGNLIA